jgi:hypothetical protein
LIARENVTLDEQADQAAWEAEELRRAELQAKYGEEAIAQNIKEKLRHSAQALTNSKEMSTLLANCVLT